MRLAAPGAMMGAMGYDDSLLRQITPVLSEVRGVAAVVLGGSRAQGTATDASDYDIGLYFRCEYPLDTEALLRAVRPLVDNPETASVTPVGEWGPWIIGGGWLRIAGKKVDILYREVAAVDQVIADARAGRISMHYQPDHPHGFCAAHWMGEVALCRPLHDPAGVLTALKAKTTPCPSALGQAPIRAGSLGGWFQHRECRPWRRSGRSDPRRRLRLSCSLLCRPGAVRAELAIPNQREGRASGGARIPAHTRRSPRPRSGGLARNRPRRV
jgi:Nucleotidyltransferase domain